jgi:hypothetical protein
MTHPAAPVSSLKQSQHSALCCLHVQQLLWPVLQLCWWWCCRWQWPWQCSTQRNSLQARGCFIDLMHSCGVLFAARFISCAARCHVCFNVPRPFFQPQPASSWQVWRQLAKLTCYESTTLLIRILRCQLCLLLSTEYVCILHRLAVPAKCQCVAGHARRFLATQWESQQAPLGD